MNGASVDAAERSVCSRPNRGVDPATCTWSGGDGKRVVDVLTHRAGFHFDFIFQQTWRYSYEPGNNVPRSVGNAGSWGTLLGQVGVWARAVKAEVETPDLWTQLERERELLGGASGEIENSPFAPDELDLVLRELRDLKTYAATHMN